MVIKLIPQSALLTLSLYEIGEIHSKAKEQQILNYHAEKTAILRRNAKPNTKTIVCIDESFTFSILCLARNSPRTDVL